MKNKQKLFTNGFTLIEMLVVITIIAILAIIVISSVARARKNSRDSKRKADLSAVQMALELYNNKISGYPEGSFNSIVGELRTSGFLTNDGEFVDPLGSGGYEYLYAKCGSNQYSMSAKMETGIGNGISPDCGGVGSGADYYILNK